jgi:GntR family transcriptional regulator, histidine utilization repressor
VSVTDMCTWQSVKAEILRRIKERIWRPGELLPNEAELAREFGCARATVNRAMREVAAAGYVDRRRRAGTRVATYPVRKATIDIPLIRREVERRGATWRYRLIECSRCGAPPAIASQLDLPVRSPLLHVRSLHFADNRPFVYEDRWINPAAVPEALAADFRQISANEWLVRNTGYTRGDIAFSAASASETEAEILETAIGAALFVVDRMTWNGDIAITLVRLSHTPGFRMYTTL